MDPAQFESYGHRRQYQNFHLRRVRRSLFQKVIRKWEMVR